MEHEVITRKKLIDQVYDQASDQVNKLSKKDVKLLINLTIDSIFNDVAKGDKVELARFGSFDSVKRAARTGRNPMTGKVVPIPAKKVPVFRPGKNFKEAVSGLNK